MNYIECPAEYKSQESESKSLFLGGGITDCPDWQKEMVQLLSGQPITLLNPRRENFPINDPAATEEQILWEYHHLRKANSIMFWFPKETLCPITLYELGAWSMTDTTIFVGVHPEYSRKRDVEVQTSLARPEIKVVYSLEAVAEQVKEWIKN